MKQRFFKLTDEFMVFMNIEDETSVYATTNIGYDRYFELRAIHQQPDLIPDHEKIMAFEVGKVGEDEKYNYYDIINKNLFDFPVNKIKWSLSNLISSNIKK